MRKEKIGQKRKFISTYYVLDVCWAFSQIFFYLILTITWWGRYYLCFIEEGIEAQKLKTSPRSTNWWGCNLHLLI